MPIDLVEITGTTGYRLDVAIAFISDSSSVSPSSSRPQVAVHEGVVLGLLDDALDQGSAVVLDEGSSSEASLRTGSPEL